MEEYVEIPSDSGITFNVQPNMKALEIAEKARDALLSGKFHQVLYILYCNEVYRWVLIKCSSDLVFVSRFVSIYQIATWWDIQVTLRLQLWLARLLMMLSR